MQQPSDPQELYTNIVLIGTVLTLGLAISIALAFVAIGVYNKAKPLETIKKLYEQKDRKNGRARSGGKF